MKGALIRVLLGIFLFTLLISGMNFYVTKAASYSSAGTPVSGIIWKNTTWTPEGSPYLISEVQVADNVTVLIEPGVTVIGGRIDLWGTIRAHGTISRKIVFKNVFLNVRGGILDLDHCILEDYSEVYGGVGICSLYGGDINITRSKIYNYGVIEIGHGHVNIEYNQLKIKQIWVKNSLGTLIRYNVFINVSDSTRAHPGYITDYFGGTVVQYNTFKDAGGIILALSPGYSYAHIVATENYWETDNITAIELMIYDRKDNLECGSFIEYLPILAEPHPDTPILLEAVEVNINGVFKKYDDGKWRCSANVTITNNSHRNVTLRWVYLEAINITYIDETFEELDISGNETINYVLQPQQGLFFSWTITEYGFTKEPKIVWILLQTPIFEAYETITLTTAIPEFPSIPALLMLMILLTTVLFCKSRITKILKG